VVLEVMGQHQVLMQHQLQEQVVEVELQLPHQILKALEDLVVVETE
tara:strand:+ start:435 stop:572 length:138 start_codon:yes stop_codon:yes gene_type:complete